MHIRDAMIKVLSNKERAVRTNFGIAIYWDNDQRMYNVYEEDKNFPDTHFNDVENAVDYFLKITKDDRIARTEEEIDSGVPNPFA